MQNSYIIATLYFLIKCSIIQSMLRSRKAIIQELFFVSALRDLPANMEYSLKTDTSCRQCLVIGSVVNHKRFREDDSKSIYSQCLGESEVMENFTDL